MAKPGFKPGDRVIITKSQIRKISGTYVIERIAQVYLDQAHGGYFENGIGYWTKCGLYISQHDECELDQAWYNEQKLKKVLGME